MPYDFEDSKDKLKKEIAKDIEEKTTEAKYIQHEKPVTLSFNRPFLLSFIVIFLFYLLTFNVISLPNDLARYGLWLYLSYPSLSIIAEILFTKKVRYRYYEGSLSVGKTRYERSEIKKVAITEYAPYYCKNKAFRLPAFNMVGYREYSVRIMPVKGKEEAFFFLCTKDSVEKFITFLYKHKIQYGIVEKEFRKLFFYY